MKVTGGGNARDHTYTYDAHNRLGNIKNTVGGATVVGLGYDPQGNLANKNGQGYTFDFGNRLRSVTGKASYVYDGHGRRVRDYTTASKYSLYSQSGQLVYATDARQSRATQYIYLGGSLVAFRETPTSGSTPTIKYQHTDALGTPIAVTNDLKTVVETSEYEPYGQLVNRALTDGPGFTGHVQDAATGLTYMQQRYYDPSIGRTLSVDPVTAYSNGDMRFFNRYAYAFNNPYKFIDPDGRATENAFWSGDQLFYNAGENFNIKGTYTFAGHGDAGLIQIDKSAKQVRGLTLDQAYTHMQKTGLQPGQDAFSISCRFGMVGRDGQIMAQQVADRNGSNVYGADGWVNYEKKGDITTLTVWSGRNKTGDQGAFQLFTPGGKDPAPGAAIKGVSINSKTGEVKFEPVRREAPTGSHIKR